MQYHTAHSTQHTHTTARSTRHSNIRHSTHTKAHSTQHAARSTHLGSRSTAPLPSNKRLLIEDGINPGRFRSLAFSSTVGSSLGAFPLASSTRDLMPALRSAAASWEREERRGERGGGEGGGRGRG